MAPGGEPAQLTVERIGGIEATTVELSPGVSVLTGRNATNRTSLLQGLMAALGSDAVSLKGDAEEGRARLTVGDETYTRTLTRANGTVVLDGDPYLSDPTVADLFAFLLESNEARRAVANEADLRELIMRSVDTEGIREEISDLRAEYRRLDGRIEDISTLEGELEDLRDRRTDLEDSIEDLEAELVQRREQLDRETLPGEDSPDERLERLRELNADLDDVEFELEAERESLSALEDEASEIRADLAEFPDEPATDLTTVETELEELQEQRAALDTEITDLQRTIRFNERLLGDDETPSVVAAGPDTGELSSAPRGDADRAGTDVVVCWTCGSTVQRRAIERTLDHLRTLRDERREQRAEVGERIEELRARRAELQEVQRQRSHLRDRLSAVESEREDRQSRIDELRQRRETIRTEIDHLERSVEGTEDDQRALLAAHREVNRIEFELERRREERDQVAAEIAEVESELDRRSELQARQDGIDDRIAELRRRIVDIERTAVGEFNDHMAQVLDILEYTKLSRIWIERQDDDPAGGENLPTGRFVLHIERRTDDGTTYEDVIDHLSESEREVTGLVFAFAGYLVHDVYDTVPFLLLDSLEAVDAERIRKLVNYVRPYTDFLVVALLSEDARALPDSYRRIRDI